MEWTFTLEELPEMAKKLLELKGESSVIAFHGNLGAGKTTFINALCHLLGVEDAVSSPTFSIINQYYGRQDPVYHIDLYRLQDEEEASRAGVEDCLISGDLCLVEWPEKAAGLFPPETLHVYLDTVDEQRRLMRIKRA